MSTSVTIKYKTKDTNGEKETTKFKYDEQNQLIQKENALGNIVKFEYDKLGRVVKETDELGNFKKYEYDGNNNITKITNEKNEITNFSCSNFIITVFIS